MKKLTFDALPGAIAEILDRLDRVEQLLNGKTSSKTKVKKPGKKRSADSMDINDAAKMLNVSAATVYNYVKKNSIPFEKKGRKLTFSRTALEALQQEKANAKKATTSKSTSKKAATKKATAKKTATKKATAKKAATKKTATKKADSKKVVIANEIDLNSRENITPQEAEKLFKKPLTSIYYQIRTRKLQPVEKKGRDKYYAKNELSSILTTKKKRSPKKPA